MGTKHPKNLQNQVEVDHEQGYKPSEIEIALLVFIVVLKRQRIWVRQKHVVRFFFRERSTPPSGRNTGYKKRENYTMISYLSRLSRKRLIYGSRAEGYQLASLAYEYVADFFDEEYNPKGSVDMLLKKFSDHSIRDGLAFMENPNLPGVHS